MLCVPRLTCNSKTHPKLPVMCSQDNPHQLLFLVSPLLSPSTTTPTTFPKDQCQGLQREQSVNLNPKGSLWSSGSADIQPLPRAQKLNTRTLQCSQTARGTKVPLWYPFEAHDLRIHPGGVDHQDEYQDTTNIHKCTETTAAKLGQGLNDQSASET